MKSIKKTSKTNCDLSASNDILQNSVDMTDNMTDDMTVDYVRHSINILPTGWKELLLKCITEEDMSMICNIYNNKLIKSPRGRKPKKPEHNIIYPPKEHLFECFKYFDIDYLNVVILGQDPYHQPNQAHGLAFSTFDKTIPASLRNIYNELKHELCINNSPQLKTGNLTSWAEQGVLLLNTCLTVKKDRPNIHKDLWKHITDKIIQEITKKKSKHLVYLLWGKNAESKAKYIDKKNNFVFISSHPSPLSANRGGWFKTYQFILANEYLSALKLQPIDWLPDPDDEK